MQYLEKIFLNQIFRYAKYAMQLVSKLNLCCRSIAPSSRISLVNHFMW